MATTTFQKILSNLSTNPNVKKLVANFNDLSSELKGLESDLMVRFDQQKKQKVAQALKKYKDLVKTLNGSEKKLEKEVNSAVSQIKKSAAVVEKNIVAYRKKAATQVSKIEKTLFAAKTTAKKTTKKASSAKKATKKVTRKATTKKAAK